MTRKKWNKLRRDRPELFKGIIDAGWEYAQHREELLRMSTAQVIARLSALQLNDGELPAGLSPNTLGGVRVDKL